MRKLWFVLVGVVVAAVIWQSLRSKQLISEPVNQIISTGGTRAPGFEGGGQWLNSEPLTLDKLREDKKAVLVDFWTYSCVNCQRTIPYLKSWWEKYKDKGLVIVGVHSPEFEFEKETVNVEMAINKYGVGWPVVQDNGMKIWQAYGNNYWPRKYLINSEGKIVYDHIGEGGYEETEGKIQELLDIEIASYPVTEEPKEGPMGFGMPFGDAQGKRQTPELYVNERGKSQGHLGKGMDKVELMGDWKIGEDYAETGEGARLKLEFQAGEVNLVMSFGQNLALIDRDPVLVQVSVDDESERSVVIQDNDLYSLWKGEFGKHTLEMSFDKGVRVHAFTFGK